MTIRRTINSLLLILLICITAGCSEPGNAGYAFFKRDFNDSQVVSQYSFKFAIDSSVTYKTFIACRIDRRLITEDSIPFEISLLSPSGYKYGEKVSFPIVEGQNISVSSTVGNIYDIEWPYRENIALEEDFGDWNVMIKVADDRMAKGVMGIGFSYE